MNLKLLKVADVREILDKYSREEITYNKMVELLNERANERLILLSGEYDPNKKNTITICATCGKASIKA